MCCLCCFYCTSSTLCTWTTIFVWWRSQSWPQSLHFFISDDMEMFHECTREEKEHPSKTPKKTKMESKKQMLLESNNIDNTKSALEKVNVRHTPVMWRIEDVASFEVLYHQMISSLTGFVGRMISLRKFKHSLVSFFSAFCIFECLFAYYQFQLIFSVCSPISIQKSMSRIPTWSNSTLCHPLKNLCISWLKSVLLGAYHVAKWRVLMLLRF